MPNTVITLERPQDYCAKRAHVFRSAASFAWFMRQHKAKLVEVGALTRPTGNWLVQPEAFDAFAASIGAARAKGA